MYCPACGTPMAADDRFCPSCGGAIHGRETLITEERVDPPRRSAAWPLGVAAGLVIAGLIVGGWWLVNRKADATTEPSPARTAVAAVTESPSTATVLPPVETQTVTQQTVTQQTAPQQTVYVAPPQTVTVTKEPDRTVYVNSNEGAGSSLVGRHVAVLDSLGKSSYTRADAENRARSLAAPGAPTPFVLDSSSTPGLRGGYWAVVVGPYSSESAARSVCSSFGRSPGGSCYPRHLR